jgi:uncharacterized membrane protein YeiH
VLYVDFQLTLFSPVKLNSPTMEGIISEFNFVYGLDLLGTFVFALSGVLTAIEKKFDAVGAIVIGAATAIGGGTIRDLLIGRTPVGWMMDVNYVYIIILAMIVSYAFGPTLKTWRKGMFLFDTIGLGLFTTLGVQATLEKGLPAIIAIMMGITSAVMGGVIRDTLTNRVPLIFRKEIYASACLAGALVFVFLYKWTESENVSMIISVGIVIVIRVLAVRNKWELPIRPRQ